jgi:hypothetical protein
MKQQNPKPKKHSQDVYQAMKYGIEKTKLVYINKNEVKRLGEIINLS